MHRFFVPGLGNSGDAAPLPPDEAQHLLRVLRLGVGAPLRVFDGHGHEFDAVVESLTRRDVIVRLGSPASPAPEAGVRVTVAQALLKGDKFDDVVRDLTMLGVAAVQPIVTAHTDVRQAGDARVERWRRVAVSSAKQCGRAVVPEIHAPLDLTRAVDRLPAPLILLAEPGAGTTAGSLPATALTATLVCGPEGGWSSDELTRLRGAGAVAWRLGGRTIRADAIAPIALALLLHDWQAL